MNLKKVCARCEVPPVADPEVPPEFPAYEHPEFDEPMNFAQYEDAVLAAAEEVDLEEETVVDSDLEEEIVVDSDLEEEIVVDSRPTPEELEQALVEEFCVENVPGYADYFASLP